MHRLRNIITHCIFGLIAGGIYLAIEIIWRGHTHWTMLPLSAIIFVMAGLLDEYKISFSFWTQVIIGTLIATALEFIAGLILNIYFKLGIWDYSNMPFNFMGQICPQFTVAWAFLMVLSIKLENLMHKIADKITKGSDK